MRQDNATKNIALAALAGVLGTAVVYMVRTANQKIAPETMPPMREDPGEFMVDKAASALLEEAQEAVTEPVKSTAATLLSFGYGSTGAALYTAFRSNPDVAKDGALLGAGIWAAGYLGWLPALKLTPSVKKQTPVQVLTSLGQHVLFGITTVGAYRKFKETLT